MAVYFAGVRHHGPGSAKQVVNLLKQVNPDLILLEGPPEGESLLSWASDETMKPPVALLAYVPDNPQQAVFYPFAEFSPEWQAILYSVKENVPLRFFDLPLAHSFALSKDEEDTKNNGHEFEVRKDPISYLAEADGHEDGEQWWELNFESRVSDQDTFQAVKEAMSALRETLPPKMSHREKLREAWMRKMIHTAEKQGFEKIVVISGAWHTPAIDHVKFSKEDQELLKGLQKVKIEVTWIPWTYDRLSFRSGYGAGIFSPGWYDHLWHFPKDDGSRWMSKVGHLLRQKNMDTSVAHIIESVRLANALAALRNYSRPGLAEFNEATATVISFGDTMLLQLIREELIISDKIGSVPELVPKVPLLTDIEKQQKSLRLPVTEGIKDLTLDLRETSNLGKSVFLHRLNLLGVNWGRLTESRGKGTFKESWQLKWEPEYSIRIIEKGIWGNTLEEASHKFLVHEAVESNSTTQLVALLQQTIPADLPSVVEAMVQKLDSLSANTSDITELMKSVPGLANIVRYGNVRKTDIESLGEMLYSMAARVCIGLPLVVVNIDIDAAEALIAQIGDTDYAISILNNPDLNLLWQEALTNVQLSNQTNPLIAGFSTRLLRDKNVIEYQAMAKHLSYYMSVNNAPAEMAYWFEGFLRSSGSILILDDNLWNLMNEWITSIPEDQFTEILPVLRRTFASFSPAERRKIGERAKDSSSGIIIRKENEDDFDHERAKKVLPVVQMLLGLKMKHDE